MRRVSIVILVLLASVAHAQDPMKLSLQQCIDYALKNNYTVKNSRIDVEIQHMQNNQVLAASYPHINGQVQLNDFYVPQQSFIDAHSFDRNIPVGTITPISFTIPYAASASITTSQLIFDGAVFVAWKARNTVLEMSRRVGMVTEENVRYGVLKAYNSLVIAYRQYDITKASLAYARSLERDVEITRQNGFAEKIDVERTSVQVNNLATDSIRIANLLQVSENALKYQMGMDMSQKVILTDTNIEQRRKDVTALLAEDKNYERVPEYNMITTQLRLNEYNLERYKLAALPSLSGFWQYGANYGSNIFSPLWNFNNYWSSSTLGLTLNVPIFNGLLRINQVKEARLNIEKTKNNIENVKLTIDFQAATARTTLQNALLAAQSQNRNLDLANDVLDLAQRKYKAGVGSNIEVTQAQSGQLLAQSNYFSALLQVIDAEADLKKALGLLKQ